MHVPVVTLPATRTRIIGTLDSTGHESRETRDLHDRCHHLGIFSFKVQYPSNCLLDIYFLYFLYISTIFVNGFPMLKQCERFLFVVDNFMWLDIIVI